MPQVQQSKARGKVDQSLDFAWIHLLPRLGVLIAYEAIDMQHVPYPVGWDVHGTDATQSCHCKVMAS